MPPNPGRKGLRRVPRGGWPLDGLFVGVATLRTTRELFQQAKEWPRDAPRAWDLALWNGVSPQGSADALERIERVGLATALRPRHPGRAPGYRLEWRHPLARPLAGLFKAEWFLAHRYPP